ncbi:MAG: hypothetical protein M0Z96_04140 [Actinomycetota bacterium]|nr:hypothetical protein [Actinomycetota bacterium]
MSLFQPPSQKEGIGVEVALEMGIFATVTTSDSAYLQLPQPASTAEAPG